VARECFVSARPALADDAFTAGELWHKSPRVKTRPDVVVENLRRAISSLYQATRSVERDLLPTWRGKRVDEIGKRDIIDLLDKISDRGAPLMARRTQAFVRRFFRWCIERDVLKAYPTTGHVTSQQRQEPRPASKTTHAGRREEPKQMNDDPWDSMNGWPTEFLVHGYVLNSFAGRSRVV
jgi:hypothetical protein